MALEFGGDNAFHETNLATFQINQMRKYGNEVALVDARTDRRYTYADVIDRIERVAAGLRDLGMRRGDVLAILTYNHVDYHVIWYATCMLGGTLQTLAPSYTNDDLLWRFQQCNTKFLVTTSDQIKRVSTIVHTLKLKDPSLSKPNILKQIIVYGDETNAAASGHVTYESLLSHGRVTSAVDIEPGKDVCILLSSSGTTGLPKHVMLTHRNIVASIPQLQECMSRNTRGMVAIVGLAVFHHYGVHTCLNVGLYTGLKMVVMERYRLEELLTLVQKHKAQILQMVPPMFLQIVKHPRLHECDLSSVTSVTTAAAPFGIELERKVKQTFGLNVCGQAYGLTECGSTGNGGNVYKEGSIGVIARGVKLKIADIETGRALPAGEVGEILLAGPQVTLGYLHRPEYTRTCFDEQGYFRTGDLGYMDTDGFVFYKDRLKEVIKYKATQVAPAYLEDVLKKHPGIADAAVVAIDDEDAGELPKAFVVRQPGSGVTAPEVHRYMDDHVASYMKLRGGIEFTDTIPKTASGKILRRLLKEKSRKAKL